MTKINLGEKNIKIKEYNGLIESSLNEGDISEVETVQQLTFSRSKNNHQYTFDSRVFYIGDCRNNLVVSYGNDVELRDVKNAFIFSAVSQNIIIPITNFRRILEIGGKLSQRVKGPLQYQIPNIVKTRECGSCLDREEINKALSLNYDLSVRDVAAIGSKYSSGRIYHVTSENGEKFVLRKWDNEKDLRSKYKLSNKLPEFFPRIFPCKRDVLGLTIEHKLYALEEYVEGEPIKGKFFLKGSYIAKLHSRIDEIFKEDLDLRKNFGESDRGVNESSLLSIYFDMLFNRLDHTEHLAHLEKIISNRNPEKLRKIPKRLTHGDLNVSNIRWKRSQAKIIDLETLAQTPRITELFPTITLLGNNQRARYEKDSIRYLLSGYNGNGVDISPQENEILFDLVKISLLKSYAIKNLRRSIGDKEYAEETKRLLKVVEEDSKK